MTRGLGGVRNSRTGAVEGRAPRIEASKGVSWDQAGGRGNRREPARGPEGGRRRARSWGCSRSRAGRRGEHTRAGQVDEERGRRRKRTKSLSNERRPGVCPEAFQGSAQGKERVASRWEPALAQEQGVDRRKEDKQAGAAQVDKERRRSRCPCREGSRRTEVLNALVDREQLGVVEVGQERLERAAGSRASGRREGQRSAPSPRRSE